MSEEIIKVLDELGKRFGMAIDWSNQNIMPYLQELIGKFIAYKNAQAVLWIIISIVAIWLSIWGIKKVYKWKKENDIEEFDDGWVTFLTIMAITISALIIFTITLVYNMDLLVQNIFIPELTIMNYIKGLM